MKTNRKLSDHIQKLKSDHDFWKNHCRMAELKIEKLDREQVNKEKEWSDKEKIFESNKLKLK